MQRAWEKLEGEDILMLAVNVGENEDIVFQFTANYPVEFPLLMDLDSAVLAAWPVRGLPTTFVVDPQGRIVYRAIGGREWDDPELLESVRELKQSGPSKVEASVDRSAPIPGPPDPRRTDLGRNDPPPPSPRVPL